MERHNLDQAQLKELIQDGYNENFTRNTVGLVVAASCAVLAFSRGINEPMLGLAGWAYSQFLATAIIFDSVLSGEGKKKP